MFGYFCTMTYFRPSNSQMPLIVKNLLIVNVLVFLAQMVFESKGYNNTVNNLFALHYWASPEFRWWQPLTHMFMHGSIMHIVFNMFALWMFGRILENMWGPRRFLLFYLICGLGAAMCHLAVVTYQMWPFQQLLTAYEHNPNISDFFTIATKYPIAVSREYANNFLHSWQADQGSMQYASQSIELLKTHMNEPMVGASGAIFGLLFAFGYLFPNTELFIYFIPIPIKAKYFVAGYALIELFSGVQNSAGDNVAHFAHLGGMLFAFILLRIWNNKIRNRFY